VIPSKRNQKTVVSSNKKGRFIRQVSDGYIEKHFNRDTGNIVRKENNGELSLWESKIGGKRGAFNGSFDTGQSVSQSVSQSTNQSINKSIKQTIN